jgi:hypothetical protein
MKRYRHNCPECNAAHTCTILGLGYVGPMESVHQIKCRKSGKSFTRTDTYDPRAGLARGTFAQSD